MLLLGVVTDGVPGFGMLDPGLSVRLLDFNTQLDDSGVTLGVTDFGHWSWLGWVVVFSLDFPFWLVVTIAVLVAVAVIFIAQERAGTHTVKGIGETAIPLVALAGSFVGAMVPFFRSESSCEGA